jgi:hypothetical protein
MFALGSRVPNPSYTSRAGLLHGWAIFFPPPRKKPPPAAAAVSEAGGNRPPIAVPAPNQALRRHDHPRP